jgi:hypothetical protein
MPSLLESFAGRGARGQVGDRAIPAPGAQLNRARIVEEYRVHQDISVNSSIEQDPNRTGVIELAIPYDGFRSFTREAIDCVEAELDRRQEAGPVRVEVARLKLENLAKTDLGTRLDISDGELVPVEVEVDGAGIDQLSADDQTRAVEFEYVPRRPETTPADLQIDLFDPDSLETPEVNLLSEDRPGAVAASVQEQIKDKMRQQVGFKNELILCVVVRLHVPATGFVPQVARVTVAWPTITSLRALEIHCIRPPGELDEPYDEPGNDEVPLLYNPYERRLEWAGRRMYRVRSDEAKGRQSMRTYVSEAMLLTIRIPGELYQEASLEVGAEVEIGGYLLSELTAQLLAPQENLPAAKTYDAERYAEEEEEGEPEEARRSAGSGPARLTRVTVNGSLYLDDAFRKRNVSPYQQLFFDEIIPDDMRVSDIVTALKDRGFETPDTVLRGGSQNAPEWFLEARRQEGPDTMRLWILVEGKRYKTEREITVPGGGMTHKTELDSGELRVCLLGLLRRDFRAVTREMNELHRLLRERYRRVRQRR